MMESAERMSYITEYISSYATITQGNQKIADELSGEGKTPLFFALDDKVLGIIAVADTIKDDSKDAIESIKKMGIKTVMLTGDNQRTANAIGKLCGVDEIIAGVHPDGKEQVVRQMQKNASVAMVGDGINDAPALTSADVGIAIGAGVDIAIDAADVVVTSSMLSDVASAITLSRKTLRNIKENLFWAFCYNVIGIPLAAGVWISALGWEMNPMFGAAAMSLSSFCVVTNALRLNFAKIKEQAVPAPTVQDKSRENSHTIKNSKNIITEKEDVKMEKTFNIEGMMCPHCEARVKKVLEEIDGVESVVASHEKNNAVITLSKDVDDSVIIKTIEQQGYTVK